MEETNCIDGSIFFSMTNDEHVSDCSADCQAQLWSSLGSEKEAAGAMCQTFAHLLEDGRGGSLMFYHCGSHLCKMKSLGDLDQDLTIHRFLNSCQRNGHGSAFDPISSGQEHVRSNSIVDGQEHARRQQQQQQQQQSTTPVGAVPTVTLSGFMVEGFHTITTKINPTPASEIAHGVAASESSVSRLVTTTETSKPLHHRTEGKNQVPVTTKVTIGVSVMVGILAVVALIAWHLRLKARFRNKKRISRPIKPSSLPPTPLISPSNSYAGPPCGPLTPPPRLQERRFLLTRALSLRRNNHRRQYNEDNPQEWAGVPLSPMPPLSPVSPLSPTSPPSTSRIRRNPEEVEHGGITAITTISQTTSLTRPLRDDVAACASVSSIFSSASTLRATSNVSADSAQVRYSGATATELPRPTPRLYETPPVVRGLASPGPPPTRALPSLPTNGRMSPLKSPPASSTGRNRQGSPSFAAVAGPSTAPGQRNGDSQRSGEESHQGGAGRSVEMLQSPRRVRHMRSPLLNVVCLDGMTQKE